ncbi:MAG: VPLPA-CTERM sorting domain-containing protein [Pseudomonadota bacterium]|nr:VPLPA-CTERM sorting domain-containing protein [Pseudomonadota bacterium]
MIRTLPAASLAALLSVSAAQALPITLLKTLAPSDAPANSGFGESVAISGGDVLVGASGVAANAGAAYFYADAAGAAVETKLTASDGQNFDRFGASVALDGGRALIGAYGDNPTGSGGGYTGQGAAYLFSDLGGSNAEVKLTAPDGAASDNFGTSVDLSGDRALVGAPDDGRGSGWLFAGLDDTLSGIKLHADSDSRMITLGTSVALADGLALLGAPGANATSGSNEAGRVQAFDGGGALVLNMDHPVQILDADFGFALDASGDSLLVGAPGHTESGANYRGSAFIVHDVDGTPSVIRLLAPGAADYDYFGSRVALSGDYAVVSAPGVDGPAYGTVYVFDAATGAFLDSLSSPAAANEGFGSAIALFGDLLVVGASTAGKAYVYSLSGAAPSSAVPLPAAAPLLAAGLGGLAALRRRRRG